MPTSLSSSKNPIKVMVVDDSVVIRGFITKFLEPLDDIEVTSIAQNGQIAVANLLKKQHDIILLDVEMPVMDGLTTIPKLLDAQPGIKIIMCSTLTTENAETSLRALALGAVECIAKPTSTQELSKDGFSDTIIRTIREIAGSNVSALASQIQPRPGMPARPGTTTPPAARGPATRPPVPPGTPPKLIINERQVKLRSPNEGFAGKPELLAIGSSTGGPNALFKLLGTLRGIDVPVIITQHMPPTFTRILAQHIQQQTGLSAVEVEDGMPLVAGRIHVARGGYHLLVERKGATAVIRTDEGPMENFCRPAVDPMLRSAAKVFGNKVMAVILTGMGSDGMLGARDIVAAGGRVIAQDAATSVVWGMPGAAASDGTCTAVLPLDEIGPWLRKSSLRLP